MFVAHKLATNDPHFRGGFFKIFLMQSFVEYVCFLEGSFLKRMDGEGVFKREWFAPTPDGGLRAGSVQWLLLMGYSSFYLYFSHTAIAVNRFTAIRFPSHHAKIWSGHWLKIILLLIALLPVPFVGVRLVHVDIRPADRGNGFFLRNFDPWTTTANAIIYATLSYSTCTLSCVLTIWSFILYRRLSNRRQREHFEDYRILLYAAMALPPQMWLASMNVVSFLGSVMHVDVSAVAVVDWYTYALFIDIVTLSGPVCLLMMSKTTRRAYVKFYAGWMRKTETSPPTRTTVNIDALGPQRAEQ